MNRLLITRSIRWRLLWWLALLLVCVLSALGFTAYQLNRLNLLSQIDQALESRITALQADFRGKGNLDARPPGGPPRNDDRDGPPPPPPPDLDDRGPRGPPPFPPSNGERGPGAPPDRSGPNRFQPDTRIVHLSAETVAMFEERDANGYYYVIWSRNGPQLKASENVPPNVPIPARSPLDAVTHHRTREGFREAFHYTEQNDCVLAGISVKRSQETGKYFATGLALACSIVLFFGLAGGWVLAGRALRPIREISSAAERISAGQLAERIKVSDTDSELGQLAGVLNATFARLDAAFTEQKHFTADASHELRTPLTVLISDAQTTLARERTAAEYRETLEACLATAQQMRRLTESLLQLARLDAGQEPMKRTRFDLADVVRLVADQLRAVASERRIKIESNLSVTSVTGDADRIAQVAANLISNAIRYNKADGTIKISVRPSENGGLFSVTDTGVGISSDDLPRIFERFYRADKARSGTEDGNSGLGLAITHSIVQAHGGEIRTSSELGVGSTFTVYLPS